MPYANRIVIFLVAVNFLNYFDRYTLAAVLDPIGKELGLTDSQLGTFPSAFMIIYMCAAPFVGVFAEKFSRTTAVALGVALWSLATALSGLASNYEQLLVCRALLGIGEAVYGTLGPAIICDLFPERQRTAKFTLFYLAIPLGSALGFGVSGILAQYFGWRASFFIAGLPGLIFAWFMYRMVDPPKGQFDMPSPQDKEFRLVPALKAIFSNPIWLSCTAAYTLYTFAIGALTHWVPTMIQRKFGVSTGESGLVFGALAALSGIVGTFLGGIVSAKGEARFPAIGLWISLAGLMVAAGVLHVALDIQSLTLCYVLLTVAMILLFINTSPINVITVNSLAPSRRALGTSINIFLIHILGDAISPSLIGIKSDALGTSGESLSEALKLTVYPTFLAGVVLLGAVQPLRRKK